MIALLLALALQAKPLPERPQPTVADFAYGTDSERQKLDFWKAKSESPTPLVLLIHGGGFATVYAHAARLGVSRGERVRKGQVVGEVGATGNASGPHLHFEIRRRDRPRNPLLYLPAEP